MRSLAVPEIIQIRVLVGVVKLNPNLGEEEVVGAKPWDAT